MNHRFMLCITNVHVSHERLLVTSEGPHTLPLPCPLPPTFTCTHCAVPASSASSFCTAILTLRASVIRAHAEPARSKCRSLTPVLRPCQFLGRAAHAPV